MATLEIDIKVYAFFSGYLKTETQHFLKDTRVGVPITAPVPFFLIKHGESWVAFDTGNNIMVARDPIGYWSAEFVMRFAPIMREEDEFKNQIKKLGISPKDLRCVILSHGHRDHAGAVDNFRGTNVPIYMQKEEIADIGDALAGSKTAFFLDSFKYIKELNVQPIEGIFDVFSDQTIVTFPTRGHTIGCQSLMVRMSNGKTLILAGDAVYTLENLTKAIPPPAAWDPSRVLETLYFLRVMKHIGAEIVPSHDPEYWKSKPMAPEPFEFL
jgi:N-acyl homoserine lactone hydrolase